MVRLPLSCCHKQMSPALFVAMIFIVFNLSFVFPLLYSMIVICQGLSSKKIELFQEKLER